jgi:hypothetical protein
LFPPRFNGLQLVAAIQFDTDATSDDNTRLQEITQKCATTGTFVLYKRNAPRPKWRMNFSNWAEVRARITQSRQAAKGDILRVLAPSESA